MKISVKQAYTTPFGSWLSSCADSATLVALRQKRLMSPLQLVLRSLFNSMSENISFSRSVTIRRQLWWLREVCNQIKQFIIVIEFNVNVKGQRCNWTDNKTILRAERHEFDTQNNKLNDWGWVFWKNFLQFSEKLIQAAYLQLSELNRKQTKGSVEVGFKASSKKTCRKYFKKILAI